MAMGDDDRVHDDDALARVVSIYTKSMMHPKAHPQAVLEALQDMQAAVVARHGQWRSHDFLALLKATDMGMVVTALCNYPSRRVAALAKQVLHAWNHTIGNNVFDIPQNTSPEAHDPECPPSPHVYVIVDDDAAADDVLVTPSSVATKILKQVAASATSTRPSPVQSSLAKSTKAWQDITSHSDLACGAVPQPDAPVVARKRSFNDVKITPLSASTCSTTGYQAKLEASRRKLHTGYERAKRLHTICLVRPDQLPASKHPKAGAHAVLTSHGHRKAKSNIAGPQRPIKHWGGIAVVRAH